jgi:hypothetical protein
MPKPQWHALWKLYRGFGGHLDRVSCIDVEPGKYMASYEYMVTFYIEKMKKQCLKFIMNNRVYKMKKKILS